MRRATDIIWPLLAQMTGKERAELFELAKGMDPEPPPEPLPFTPAQDGGDDWRCMPWGVIDTETTGLSESSRIVHIAYVRFELGEVVDQRRMYLSPGCRIGDDAIKVHGITNEMVAKKPKFKDIADKLLERLLKTPIVVAYNAAYDLGRIRYECQRAGETFQPRRWLEEDFDYVMKDKPVIDPLVMVKCGRVGRWWKGQGRHSLENAARKMGVQFPEGVLHKAHVDAIICGRLLWALTRAGYGWPEDPAEMAAFIANRREQQEYDFQQYLARTRGSGGAAKHHERHYEG